MEIRLSGRRPRACHACLLLIGKRRIRLPVIEEAKNNGRLSRCRQKEGGSRSLFFHAESRPPRPHSPARPRLLMPKLSPLRDNVQMLLGILVILQMPADAPKVLENR